MAILPALWLPIMFKCKLDLLGEDISDEGFVVGAVLPLHLHQQLVVHPASYLLIPTLTWEAFSTDLNSPFEHV